jgi:hypothetical protein
MILDAKHVFGSIFSLLLDSFSKAKAVPVFSFGSLSFSKVNSFSAARTL